MLFNSYIFIGAFLPTVLIGYVLLGQARANRAAQIWLALASLFFYSWWNPAHLPVLLASIVFNFYLGHAIGQADRSGARVARPLLVLGIVANLGLLGYFKYTAFFVNNVAAVSGLDFALQAVVLPLGISFFTFQQITYLVDAARGDAGDYDFVDYILFVAFFPQLIAGPIVHHREMMSQFARPAHERVVAAGFAAGVTFFTIGLFKKVVIADKLAPLADEAFAASASDTAISALAAWHGTLAYTLQLYFDFSGYSDMAVGLALMFGIRLPYNFNSPYQALNIIDFWRRWHMTLSRFLRDYLYVTLGGNRRGPVRRYVNLFVTMALGGLWHGAGWTFLIWGALHGVYLIANHAWLALRARLGLNRSFGFWGVWLARLVTLVFVMIGWVFFRAADVGAAVSMLDAMRGAHGWFAVGDPLTQVLDQARELGLANAVAHWLTMLSVPFFLAVAWLAPNSQQIVDGVDEGALRSALQWRPTPGWAGCIAACLLFALSQMSQVSAFLYFQF